MPKVKFTDGCWEWQAGKDVRGYGRFMASSKESPQLAHRVMYLHVIGPIPEGCELDHKCCNPACVRPDHLEPVSHAENMRRYGFNLDPDRVSTLKRMRGEGMFWRDIAEALGLARGSHSNLARQLRRHTS